MLARVLFFMVAMLATQTFGSLIFENFNSCSDENPDIPTFTSEFGVIQPPKCDNAAKMGNDGYSARALSTPTGRFLGLSIGASMGVALPSVVSGQSYTISFYIKSGTTLAPYPTAPGWTLTGRRGIVQNLALIGVLPIPITWDSTISGGADGWFKYIGTFTAVTVPATPIGNTINGFYIGIEFGRTVTQSNQAATANIWIDNFRVDQGGVSGDPTFVGLRGQNYQVHGIDGAVYNLVSSPTTQVNSRFVFLDEGQCPIFNGIPAKNCWAHSGSYMGEIGIQQVVNGVTHKVAITSGSSTEGFASVIVDGKQLLVNDTVEDTSLFDITFAHSHTIMVNTQDFAFTFENSDMFINQGVIANKRLSQLTCHGLFGQTHKEAVYPTSLKYIEGEVDDYMVAEDDLFGVSFVYNKFGQK